MTNVFAWMETLHPEVVTDRFNSGGLNVSQPSRGGGFLSSATQTRYRIGDVDISSVVDGTPLIFPSTTWWRNVDIDAPVAIDAVAPGLGVALSALTPAQGWGGRFEGLTSGGRLTATPATASPPPIAHLDMATRVGGTVAGPLTERVGLVLGGEWAENSVATRSDPGPRRARVFSIFSHAVARVTEHRELRAIGIVQRSSGETSAHLQAALDLRRPAAAQWRVFAGYTDAERSPAALAPATATDRLIDGPVPALMADRPRDERHWIIGVAASPPPIRGSHQLSFGGQLRHETVREPPLGGRVIHEMVDTHRARIWLYDATTRHAVRTIVSSSALVHDRMALTPTLVLDAALRLEYIGGHADGARSQVSWLGAWPAVQLRSQLGTRLGLVLTTGLRRLGHRLLSGFLTVGDPNSPAGGVYRWDDESDTARVLVARVGPGGSDPTLAAIDEDMRRPYTDEFSIVLESRPRPGLRLAVAGRAARQARSMQLVNTGVTAADFRTFTIADANADLVKPDDDQQLTVFERLPASFGEDRYVLTNPSLEEPTMGAVILSGEVTTARFDLAVGATAAAAVGAGANRGFRLGENDPDLLGELFVNPNASTSSRGRLFSDRAYTIKSALVYRFPASIRLGVIARYQDGQPFARMVVVPGLNQGAEAIQAFARGRSRFAFTGTLDMRVQKGFRLSAASLDVLLDVYNLPNMRKETEEYVVTGPRFREPTAVQPPRSMHVGLRVRWGEQ